MKGQPSLVLVTVDCLRADHVGFMGYHRPTTPFLDSLAPDSYVFPSAIVAGAPTYYSFPAILASRYPLALGRDIVGLAPGELTLASVLREAGYSTAAFSAANPYISPRFGYDQGFDTFRDFLEGETATDENIDGDRQPEIRLRTRLNRGLERLSGRLGPLNSIYNDLYFQYCQRVAMPTPQSLDALRRFPSADVLVDEAGAWLTSLAGGPFFLWLHLMDPHSPYYPAAKALELMGDGEISAFWARYVNSYWNRGDIDAPRLKPYRDEITALYDAGIRWVDLQMSRLVETLRHLRLWDDCVLAFTADHGEEFLDHGGRYHPPSRLTEELIHVPLLLRVPGQSRVELDKTPFSLVHLVPTLLDAMNVPVPADFQGRSHWAQLQGRKSLDDTVVVECVAGCTNPFRRASRMGSRRLAVRDRRYKLVLQFDPGGEQLFDLESDPGELTPLAPDAEKSVRRRFLERARRHLAQSSQMRDQERRVTALARELQLEWAQSTAETHKTEAVPT